MAKVTGCQVQNLALSSQHPFMINAATGYEGGQLIGSIFNVSGEKINLLPMDGNLNKGAWKKMENTWANALKEGKQVKVKVEPSYTGNSKRPDSFTVTYQIDKDRPVREVFNNAPGGK